MGVHRALVDYTRARILAGARHPGLADEIRAEADRALALLERGLSRYALTPPLRPARERGDVDRAGDQRPEPAAQAAIACNFQRITGVARTCTGRLTAWSVAG